MAAKAKTASVPKLGMTPSFDVIWRVHLRTASPFSGYCWLVTSSSFGVTPTVSDAADGSTMSPLPATPEMRTTSPRGMSTDDVARNSWVVPSTSIEIVPQAVLGMATET